MQLASSSDPALIDNRDIWIFDLDNTLYPAECNLFAQIDVKMTAFIARHFNCDPVEARKIQKSYLTAYGATLKGLMIKHGIDPQQFLDDVHDIDFSPITPDPVLRSSIERLPGRKLIYTNADKPYTEKVLDRLGLLGVFEAIYDITAADLSPKPCPDAFVGFMDDHDVDPHRAVFFEDSIRNLKPARQRGMGCVWIDANCQWGSIDYAKGIAHAEIPLLGPWLQQFSQNF